MAGLGSRGTFKKAPTQAPSTSGKPGGSTTPAATRGAAANGKPGPTTNGRKGGPH